MSDQNTPSALTKEALKGIRVLVVDDEPILASTFCLVLSFAGAEAHPAEHGQAALDILETQKFDVILCDKHMPVMSGPEFIRRLNEQGDTTPILLFVNGFERERELGLRVSGTLTKPLLPGDLVAAIRKAARRDE